MKRALMTGVLILLLTMPGADAGAQTPPARPAPASTGAATAPQDYVFPSGAGMLFFYVKPEKARDFEAIVARLAEVLERSETPARREQAANWRVLQSVEAVRDQIVYIFLFDPAAAGADHDPIKMLGEALPAEVQTLYERLRDAVVKVERMGLRRIRF